MWVKICGIASTRAAVAAMEAGADAIGLVFASQAPAHRRLTPERAQALTAGLPPDLARVGVFVNESVAAMERIAWYAGLTHIQLHGDEPPDHLARLPRPAIKAVRLQAESELPALAAYHHAWGILLEPRVTGKAGGAGVALDWSLARAARDYLKGQGFAGRIILAGGLNPNNVRAATMAVQPDGVDVSSGVELTIAGTIGKDIAQIYAFVEQARGKRHEHGA